MVLTSRFRTFLFCGALFLLKKSEHTSIEDSAMSANCIPFSTVNNNIRDICYDHANLGLFMDNKNLSENDLSFVLLLFHRNKGLTQRAMFNFARFFCAATFDICVTEKNSAADANDSSVQIVPPCRSLCKSAQKTYMLDQHLVNYFMF